MLLTLTACLILLFCPLAHAETDPLRKAAQELADDLSRMKGIKIAVLALPHHDTHASDGPLFVSERVATYLVADRRLRVLERNHVTQLMEELHLSETGTLDLTTAKHIGEVLGADVIVTGTLIDLDARKTEINVRGLMAESGRVVAARRALVDRTWESRPMLAW